MDEIIFKDCKTCGAEFPSAYRSDDECRDCVSVQDTYPRIYDWVLRVMENQNVSKHSRPSGDTEGTRVKGFVNCDS